MAAAGFDWLCLDLQHGFGTLEDLLPAVHAAELHSVPLLVRPPLCAPWIIGRALDAGCNGVIVPMVNSSEEARAAVSACRYAPDGTRSWGPSRIMLREQDYRAERANQNVTCIVMVETRRAVEQLEEIASVPGINGVFVGPSDMAVDLGVHPGIGSIDGEHALLLSQVVERAAAAGVQAGIFGGRADAVRQYREMGFTFVAVATDAGLVGTGARAAIAELTSNSIGRTPVSDHPDG